MPDNTIIDQFSSTNSSTSKQDTSQDILQISKAMAMLATTSQPCAFTQEYSLPSELESQALFADSGASRHLTPTEFYLHNKESYVGPN